MPDPDDTMLQRALTIAEEVSAVQEAAFRATANELESLAESLAKFPERHPESWRSVAWQSELAELQRICERLRGCATDLRAVADGHALK